MSEPMSSAEIEDVLSSIRRLISDEGRHPAGRESRADAAPGKLLLTPALRVVPDEQSAPDVSPETFAMRFASSLRDRVSVIGAAAGSDDDWEADAEEGEGDDAPDAAFWAEPDEWAEPETAEFVTFPDAARPMAPPVAPEAEARAPAAEGMVFIHARRGLSPVEVTSAQPAAEPAMQVDIHDPRERILAEFKSRREAAATPAETPAPAAEPDLQDQGPAATVDDEAVATVDHNEPAVAAIDIAEPETAAFEDRLQAMVRALILEELQGDLGERITRNIRKLVRAEVARALATRDLD